MKIGKELRQLRSIINVSQQDVADWLEVKQSFISQYENDKRDAKPVTIKKIANAFDINGIPILELKAVGIREKCVFFNNEYKRTNKPTNFKLYTEAQLEYDRILDEIHQAKDIIHHLRVISSEDINSLFQEIVEVASPNSDISTIDISDLTDSEIEELKKYKEFLIYRRKGKI